MGHATVLATKYRRLQPGRVAQSVGHLTRKSGVLGSIPGLATYFHFSFRFLGLSLPRKSVIRLTDRPDMTLDVYHGRKTTIQHQQQIRDCSICNVFVLV